MMELGIQLKNNYLNWLREKIILNDLGSAIEITTPLLDRHNDHLQIFVIPQGNEFKITDDGYIINDLLMSGCDIGSSKKRREILQTILNGYGVSRSSDDELFVISKIEDFPQKKHMLLQAMISVNDMFVTSKPTIQSLFYEDVENLLDEHDIRYTDNVNFTGKSSYIHKFDFVVPKSKKSPERIIQTMNSPTKDRTQSLLFAWSDTRETRKNDSTLYAFLNDSDKSVSGEIVGALESYDIKPVLWSEREKYIDELSA
ncbi:DUF1829 domain-containing protein [Brevibacillus halotolerans]|uniref:DUF1829 domain-containing protein n=1 Tax=Brevibacillus TaxID=55080 RepID=UPI00215D45D3|nr:MULTISPECIES: DUF1829 domain-containing protein [Brevibacillus]MCR8961618.1 DUF1829 domain-containing protein [Brevibacillus laterosporus]MCZ0833773.1 DUF1829 domain-containing protein [Brevibacillus halotolerans]